MSCIVRPSLAATEGGGDGAKKSQPVAAVVSLPCSRSVVEVRLTIIDDVYVFENEGKGRPRAYAGGRRSKRLEHMQV